MRDYDSPRPRDDEELPREEPQLEIIKEPKPGIRPPISPEVVRRILRERRKKSHQAN